MIKINNSNLEEVLDLVLQYKRDMDVNNEYFSSSDAIRALVSIQDVDRILGLTVFGVLDGDFEIKFKSNLLDSYLESIKSDLLIEDEAIFEENDFRKTLELGNPRFVYELWDYSEDSIEYLCSNCTVFAKAKNTIKDVLKDYGEGFEISEIQCIRDNYLSGEIYDSSSYMLSIVNSLDSKKDIVLLIHDGGFFQDVIIIEDGSLIDIIKFDDAPKYSRIVDMCSIEKSIKNYSRYKKSLMKALS